MPLSFLVALGTLASATAGPVGPVVSPVITDPTVRGMLDSMWAELHAHCGAGKCQLATVRNPDVIPVALFPHPITARAEVVTRSTNPVVTWLDHVHATGSECCGPPREMPSSGIDLLAPPALPPQHFESLPQLAGECAELWLRRCTRCTHALECLRPKVTAMLFVPLSYLPVPLSTSPLAPSIETAGRGLGGVANVSRALSATPHRRCSTASRSGAQLKRQLCGGRGESRDGHVCGARARHSLGYTGVVLARVQVIKSKANGYPFVFEEEPLFPKQPFSSDQNR